MRNKKLKLLIAGILLVALAAPAAVTAYFTDYEEGHGGAVLNLEGQTELHEQPEDDKKTISIENTGETDVIVRVAIYGNFLGEVDYSAEDWTYDEEGGWYYYNSILKPGESTSDIVANIDVAKAKEAGHDFDIVVVHESERVTYDGSAKNKVVKPEGWILPDISASEEVGD